MPNNYNFIAPYYDKISRLIFGKTIQNAQTILLPYINPESSILIAGGGTGWILEALANVHKEGLKITYLDKSSEMIALAKKKCFAKNDVHFICTPIEDYHSPNQFDCIFTAFLFDNFQRQKATLVFTHLHNLLKPKGLWLYSDFTPTNVTQKTWQQILLKTMYLFFKIVSQIETSELVNMTSCFERNGYECTFHKTTYSQFIHSYIYLKPANK